MKYWQLYTELYPVMVERGGARFPQLFAEEFVRAYEREIANSRRGNRPAAPQKPTVETLEEVDFEQDVETEIGDALEPDAEPQASNS